MTLGITALAVRSASARYVPLSTVSDLAAGLPRTRLESSGIPESHLLVQSPDDVDNPDAPDVSAQALAAVGGCLADPLFLVRSGPQRDTMVVAIARLVHESGWAGEEVGLTHLDELGGTVVFDLLEWAVPESGATVVICDEPLFADARAAGAGFSAVGLRVQHGAGPLVVLGVGEGAPGSDAAHYFSGSGPCDSWVAFSVALAAGEIRDGDRVLLHAKGPNREGWLSLEAGDTKALVLG